jgi:exoribonuclease R
VAVLAGAQPDAGLVASLESLPKAMAQARGREGNVSRAVIDLVEVLVLTPRIGQVLDATVVATAEARSTVVLAEPAVLADVDGHVLPLGERVRVRIDGADPVARAVQLSPA